PVVLPSSHHSTTLLSPYGTLPDLPSFPTRRSSDLAICCNALFAVLMESLMPASALARSVWIPCEVALSCCAIDCAALTTPMRAEDRKSTRLNSSHVSISYAGFCLKKKKSNKATKRL